MVEYETTRAITQQECPWLKQDIPRGKRLFEYEGYTYGCIGPTGVAVSEIAGDSPFFEVPCSAVVTTNAEAQVRS